MALPEGQIYQPELYAAENKLQLEAAPKFLKKYQHLIKWRNGGNVSVVDLGSGTGCTTVKVLKPFLPANFKELIGLDKDPAMIEYARKHYLSEKTDFKFVDICKSVPLDLENRFDHMFSFYCIHFIQDQLLAFKNIHDLLAPGGSILATLMVYYPVFEVYLSMSKDQKWSKHIKNVHNHISPYYFSENPPADCIKYAESAGFSVESCELINTSWTHKDTATFKAHTSSVNTLLLGVPPELRDEFMEEIIERIKVNGYVQQQPDGKIHVEYRVLLLFATKPTI